MSHQFSQGDFVYLPSDTFIYQFGEDTCDWFVSQRKTDKPMYLMFLKENVSNSAYGDIFFEGSVWSVSLEDVYDYEGGAQ
jgi:hypothetical protein|tara:strand:- start:294 stop:533 length:240 start_codon:yes stop_codon:yes gene_type:complete